MYLDFFFPFSKILFSHERSLADSASKIGLLAVGPILSEIWVKLTFIRIFSQNDIKLYRKGLKSIISKNGERYEPNSTTKRLVTQSRYFGEIFMKNLSLKNFFGPK